MRRKNQRRRTIGSHQNALSLGVVIDAVHIAHKEILNDLPRSTLILGEINTLPASDPKPAKAVDAYGRNLRQLRRRSDIAPRLAAIGSNAGFRQRCCEDR